MRFSYHTYSVFIVIAIWLFLASSLYAADYSYRQQTCNPQNDLTASIVLPDKAEIRNVSLHCNYQVGLAAYKMFDTVVANQEFFDGATTTISKNQIITLQINIPSCAYQIDAFWGALLTDLKGERYSTSGRLLAGKQITTAGFCTHAQTQAVGADIKANGNDGPISIPYNTSATISWTANNATTCNVTPSGWTGVSGSQSSGDLIATRTYTLYCTGSGGSASDSVTINITSQSLPTVDITANPTQVAQGNPSVLSWTSSNATSCFAANGWSGMKGLSGSEVVSLFTTTIYGITCINATGQASDSVTIQTTTAGPSADIKANGSDQTITISENSSATISWSSQNTASCSVMPHGWFGTSGSQSTGALANTQTYTITCSGVTGGTAQDSVTVQVQRNLPTVDLTAYPSYVQQGNSSVLSWTSSNATSCFATNGWSGTKGLSGSESVFPSTTQTYTVTCSNNAGQVSDTATITVAGITPTVTLSVAPSNINRGENAVLVWSSSNATTCYAQGAWSGTKSLSGSEIVAPNSNTSYVIICTRESQQASDYKTITVSSTSEPPTTGLNVACSVSSPTAFTGQNVTFAAGQAGGTAPFVFTWSGDFSGTGQIRTLSFGTNGFKSATVTVTDAQARTKSAECGLAITSPPTVSSSPPPSQKPPIVVTTANVPQGTSCCCCANNTQIYYDKDGNPVEIATAGNNNPQNRSLLASVFTNGTGGPSTFLYMLLFLFIILALLSIIRYHLFINPYTPPRNYNSNGHAKENAYTNP